jgi:hypothetical protein
MNTVARPLLLHLAETNAHGRNIALTVAGFEIRGQLALEDGGLHIDGHDGSVSAPRALITSVSITGHGVRLGAQQLDATDVTVRWGHGGLRVEATSVSIRAVQLLGDDAPLEGTLVLEGITLSELAVHRDDIRVGRVRIATAETEVKLPARPRREGEAAATTAPASSASASIVERLLPVLDRLTGHVNVDLGLDLTVPVIGRRRAMHPFRIPIDAGTIDYRRLEDNLSTLEDALLDFSVRDEGLVLEVGIPFIPTRGKGKPIVRWSLAGEELERARQQRVRLSVLARPDREDRDDSKSDDKASALALRTADVRGLDVSLAIAPAQDSPIRRVGLFVVAGNLTYAAGEAPEGVVRGGVQDVELGALGVGRISVGGARLDTAMDVEVAFLGVTPVRARVVARSLQLDGLHVASRTHDDHRAASATNGDAGGEHARVPHARTT